MRGGMAPHARCGGVADKIGRDLAETANTPGNPLTRQVMGQL
jgi:hypothetical protein